MDNVIVMGDPTYHEFVAGVANSMDSHGFDRTVGPFSSTWTLLLLLPPPTD
jgi:hypothetical protein